MASYMCKNFKCNYYEQVNTEGYCPECGEKLEKVGFREANKLTNEKKARIERLKKIEESRGKYKQEQEEKAEKERLEREKLEQLVWNPDKKNINPLSVPTGSLFTPGEGEPELVNSIYTDMGNLYQHEAGTAWMRAGTLLSFNPTQQMVGAGFKAIIDQNKIIIKQNELIFRELKKLNSKGPV